MSAKPSLHAKAYLRVRQRASKTKACAADGCAPAYQVLSDRVAWRQVVPPQETVKAATVVVVPDNTPQLTPWEVASLQSCEEPAIDSTELFDEPLKNMWVDQVDDDSAGVGGHNRSFLNAQDDVPLEPRQRLKKRLLSSLDDSPAGPIERVAVPSPTVPDTDDSDALDGVSYMKRFGIEKYCQRKQRIGGLDDAVSRAVFAANSEDNAESPLKSKLDDCERFFQMVVDAQLRKGGCDLAAKYTCPPVREAVRRAEMLSRFAGTGRARSVAKPSVDFSTSTRTISQSLLRWKKPFGCHRSAKELIALAG